MAQIKTSENFKKAIEESSKIFEESRKIYEENRKIYDEEAEEFWKKLPYDKKLMAFYAICKRIHKAEILEHGSYRYTLYETFGFGPDSYVVGMDCGYLNIHNALCDALEYSKLSKKEKKQEEEK